MLEWVLSTNRIRNLSRYACFEKSCKNWNIFRVNVCLHVSLPVTSALNCQRKQLFNVLYYNHVGATFESLDGSLAFSSTGSRLSLLPLGSWAHILLHVGNTQATCCSAQPYGQEPSVGCWPRVRGTQGRGSHRCTHAHTWHFTVLMFKGALLQDNMYFYMDCLLMTLKFGFL